MKKIMKIHRIFIKTTVLLGITGFIVFLSCSNNTTSPTSTTNQTLPTVFNKFSSSVSITVSGNNVVLSSTDRPNHKSAYFPTTDTMYQADTDTSFHPNQFHIISQNLTFTIPISPTVASTHSATQLGPIGISLNGVPFYNQYNGQGLPLTTEIASFDQWKGHPQNTGQYHYHIEPTYLTHLYGDSTLVGFLLDGFPVYGPVENGVTITDSDLDSYHGHFSRTADYPNGIYHYHITAEAPYLNGAGYYGTPGTVTQ
jgi:hypothetical protein